MVHWGISKLRWQIKTESRTGPKLRVRTHHGLFLRSRPPASFKASRFPSPRPPSPSPISFGSTTPASSGFWSPASRASGINIAMRAQSSLQGLLRVVVATSCLVTANPISPRWTVGQPVTTTSGSVGGHAAPGADQVCRQKSPLQQRRSPTNTITRCPSTWAFLTLNRPLGPCASSRPSSTTAHLQSRVLHL